MASLLALKRRTQIATNVSKTTRAMQMIAASKLKRAQDSARAGKPYVEKLTQVAQNTVLRLDKENIHGYMKEGTKSHKTLLIVLSPDKGLVGSLVSNLIGEILNFKTKDTLFITLGKKAERAAAKLGHEIVASFPFGTTLPSFEVVYPIVQIVDDYFLSNKVSKVMILSAKFESIFIQKPQVTHLLPVKLEASEGKNSKNIMLFEPSIPELLPTLLRHFLEMTLYQNILESYASEQGARMIAMKNATDNAKELVDELRLDYNKGRQEKITNEILDISSATLALSYEE